MANALRHAYDHKARGFVAESTPNWALDGPQWWVTAQLLWDRSLDPAALLGDFCTKSFGPAAGAEMREVFVQTEKLWADHPRAPRGQVPGMTAGPYPHFPWGWNALRQALPFVAPGVDARVRLRARLEAAWRTVERTSTAEGKPEETRLMRRLRIDFYRSAYGLLDDLAEAFAAWEPLAALEEAVKPIADLQTADPDRILTDTELLPAQALLDAFRAVTASHPFVDIRRVFEERLLTTSFEADYFGATPPEVGMGVVASGDSTVDNSSVHNNTGIAEPGYYALFHPGMSRYYLIKSARLARRPVGEISDFELLFQSIKGLLPDVNLIPPSTTITSPQRSPRPAAVPLRPS